MSIFTVSSSTKCSSTRGSSCSSAASSSASSAGCRARRSSHDDDNFFVVAFQGVLCLFLLEMGMTASRKLKDLRTAGRGFIVFGLLAPNIFATLGILVAHVYAYLTHTAFKLGTYVLFAVLCGAASYIAVPAVQRLAIPEASPTLPLAASLGLTFSYNVTIGIPLYIEIARVVGHWFPVTYKRQDRDPAFCIEIARMVGRWFAIT